MSIRWKDNPGVWEDLYRSNKTSSLIDYGFSDFKSVRVEVRERPRELRELDEAGKIRRFWDSFKASTPDVTDDPKYGISGLEDLEVREGMLVMRVFPCSYKDIRFKNGREDDEGLTLEQVDFLDNRFVVLGVSGYVENGAGYLMGVRADQGVRNGLIETVPQGMVDPESDNEDDILYATLMRELKEETCLNSYDVRDIQTRGINLGPKQGDFTLIFRLMMFPLVEERFRANLKEHSELRYMSREEIREGIFRRRYDFNPVTVALVDGLNLI